MTRWTQEDLSAYQSRASVPKSSPAKPQTPQRSKYRNRKIIDAEGITHDSKREYSRWLELQQLERAGGISSLNRQTVFDLGVGSVLVCRYVADFTYTQDGALVVEDVKSEATRKLPVFRLKAKLMQACHNITVRVIE